VLDQAPSSSAWYCQWETLPEPKCLVLQDQYYTSPIPTLKVVHQQYTAAKIHTTSNSTGLQQKWKAEAKDMD
jgi:hypothetical protein